MIVTLMDVLVDLLIRVSIVVGGSWHTPFINDRVTRVHILTLGLETYLAQHVTTLKLTVHLEAIRFHDRDSH